jgi:hypothetical protein
MPVTFVCAQCNNEYPADELSEHSKVKAKTSHAASALLRLRDEDKLCCWCGAWDLEGNRWGPEETHDLLTPSKLEKAGYWDAITDRSNLPW